MSLLTRPPSQRGKPVKSIVNEEPRPLHIKMVPRPMFSNPTIICRVCRDASVENKSVQWNCNDICESEKQKDTLCP